MVRCSGSPSNPVSTTGRVIVPFSSTGSLEPSNRNQIRFFACFNYRMTGTERQIGRQACCRQR